MKECFRCHIDENHALLFETITPEGVKGVCRKCSFNVDTPIIKKKDFDETLGKRGSVYERLSSAAGINPVEHHRRLNEAKRIQKELSENKSLREIVDKMVKNSALAQDDRLIRNFHWVIMRARRGKKITQEHLAKIIGEPEAMIKEVEGGRLPRGYEPALKKIENSLGIKLFEMNSPEMDYSHEEYKKQMLERIEKNPDKILFDRKNPEQLTIGELKEMKEERFKPNPRVFERTEGPTLTIRGERIDVPREKVDSRNEPEFVEEENFEEKRDLTDEEIDDLLFGGKR